MTNRHKINMKTIEGYDHPLIEIEIGKKKLTMILDSGAIMSCLNVEDSDGIEMRKLYEVSYSGMEANRKTGDVVLTEISLDGVGLQAVFVLADLKESFSQVLKDRGIELNGMLGVDFFRLYDCILDFKEDTLEFSERPNEKYRVVDESGFMEGVDGINGLSWDKLEEIAKEAEVEYHEQERLKRQNAIQK